MVWAKKVLRYLTRIPDDTGWVTTVANGILLVLLCLWSWSLLTSTIASNEVGASFLHSINLPFHEAGHKIFGFFGQFMGSLGGTLGQFLMPAICVAVLLIKTKDSFGASVAFWWFSENFLDIAPYMADARAGQLPLVGGNFGHSSPYGFHDWEYLLTEMGMIHRDTQLAKVSFSIGTVLMIAALVWGGYVVYKKWQYARERGELA